MTHHWSQHRSRCHACNHPGGVRRRVNARKKACDCKCHQVAAAGTPLPVAAGDGARRRPATGNEGEVGA